MKSVTRGKNSPAVKVTNISKHGLWLITRSDELFVSFNEFPCFQNASVSKIMNIEWSNADYLYWPDLDVDLAVESIRRFPLVSKELSLAKRPRQRAKAKIVSE